MINYFVVDEERRVVGGKFDFEWEESFVIMLQKFNHNFFTIQELRDMVYKHCNSTTKKEFYAYTHPNDAFSIDEGKRIVKKRLSEQFRKVKQKIIKEFENEFNKAIDILDNKINAKYKKRG